MRNLLGLCFSIFFAAQSFSVENDNNDHDCGSYNLGSAIFEGNPENSYTIDPPSYPSTVPLSLNRNAGFKEGDIVLTPTGLIINKSGNYSVSFSTIVYNTD